MCRIARLNLIVALVALAALAVATVEAPAKRGVRYRRCAPLAVAQPNGVDPRGVSPGSPNPLQGLTFFVDREEKAARQARAYQRRGRRGKAARLANLANQPKFLWFGKWTRPRMTFKVRNY